MFLFKIMLVETANWLTPFRLDETWEEVRTRGDHYLFQGGRYSLLYPLSCRMRSCERIFLEVFYQVCIFESRACIPTESFW